MNSSPASVVFPDVEWPDCEWFRSNILLDHTGDPFGVDGTSRSLTRGRDRELLRALRQDAHAIVTGGATVRAEGWHFPPRGYLFVASEGQLPLESCPHVGRLRVFQFANTMPSSLADTLGTLTRECDIRHLLCESGPELLRRMVVAELIDEVFVSIAASTTSITEDVADDERTARRALMLHPESYRLVETFREKDMTYLRFVRCMPRRSPVFVAT